MENVGSLYNGRPLADQVADLILNYIIDNDLDAGAKLLKACI